MGKRYLKALVWSLALGFFGSVSAISQPTYTISLPPNSRGTIDVSFRNGCPGNQTFRIAAEPPAEWVKWKPSLLNIASGESVHLTIPVSTSGNLRPGNYQSKLMAVCLSCAATNPPCLQSPVEFPVSLTLGPVRGAERNGTAAPSTPPERSSNTPDRDASSTSPKGSTPSDAASGSRPNPSPASATADPAVPSAPAKKSLAPWGIGGLLVAAGAGALAARGKRFCKRTRPARRAPRPTDDSITLPAETERHRVRW
jgi:hypothetical protein